jgi:hypothetical protein
MSKKYIIELEEEPFVRKSALHGEEGLFRAKGFKSLVFDQNGIDKLTPLEETKLNKSELGYAFTWLTTTPEKDGTYLVYAPNYVGGSSSAKESHNGIMFSRFKNGKWSIEKTKSIEKKSGLVEKWAEIPSPNQGE